MISEQDGKRLLSIARSAIDQKVSAPEGQSYHEHRGCFVTLYKSGQLRGCIGYPLPIKPLYKAVQSAARAAAFDDPRFAPVSASEMHEITIEVSVLTVPEEITAKTPSDLISKVEPGRHGLIVEGNSRSGLLLPQVASEQGWGAQEFLEHTCIKAGLDRDSWKNPDIKVYTFEAQVFTENSSHNA